MIRKNELRSVVNETVLEWTDTLDPLLEPSLAQIERLVDQLVENIQEVWFN